MMMGKLREPTKSWNRAPIVVNSARRKIADVLRCEELVAVGSD
jgi:hypothetical protein